MRNYNSAKNLEAPKGFIFQAIQKPKNLRGFIEEGGKGF